MHKHFRIISTPRFITFLVICAVMIIYITASVVGLYNAHSLTEQTYTTVKVSEGDTLWSIACEYGDSKTDVRKTINDICELNSITSGSIKDGDIILVPDTL